MFEPKYEFRNFRRLFSMMFSVEVTKKNWFGRTIYTDEIVFTYKNGFESVNALYSVKDDKDIIWPPLLNNACKKYVLALLEERKKEDQSKVENKEKNDAEWLSILNNMIDNGVKCD